MRKILRRVVLGALVCAALVLLGALLYLQRTVPDRDAATLVAEGLDGSVRVAFDAEGRPWIDAATYGDALFALGWVQARDRRWQMELLRRAGSARLAEILGAELFATDAAMLRAGVPALAAALEAGAAADTLVWVDRFVAGVALADAHGAGSPEFDLLGAAPAPFTRADVFAIGALMAFDSANNLDNELLRLALVEHLGERAALFRHGDLLADDQPWVVTAPGAGAALVALVEALEHPARPRLATGSSAWAVAPGRSATGRALLAFDSHDAWSMPALLHEAHLFWRDEVGRPRQLRGFGVAGLPGLINGFTERGAWCLTNIGDSQDLVLETVRDGSPPQVLGADGWYEARSERFEVPVRGEAARSVEVVYTRHGPLIEEDPAIALQWTGHYHEGAGLDGLFALNRARAWNEASAAVDRLIAPAANLTWADADGRIATRVHGRLPRRARGEGLLPLAAADGAANWRGFVPMDTLPRRVDPPEAWVAAANARTSADGPLVSADNAPGYRARRIRTLLEGQGASSVADFARMQVDFHDVQAQRQLPLMLAGLGVDGGASSGVDVAVLELLAAHAQQPVQSGDSAGAVLFAYWQQALLEELFADALEPELFARLLRARYPTDHALERLLRAAPDDPWWRGDRPALLGASLARAVERLALAQGDVQSAWRWDAAHRVFFPHQLGAVAPLLDAVFSRGPWSWGGGNATLGRARYRYDRPYEARGGASMRMVVELSEPPVAHVVMPGGQSGHVLDAHYDDQFEAFLAGRLTELASHWQESERMITLVPGGGGATGEGSGGTSRDE